MKNLANGSRFGLRGLCIGMAVVLVSGGTAFAQSSGDRAGKAVKRPAGDEAADIVESLADLIRGASADDLMSKKKPKPVDDDDYYPRDEAREELGKLLFFDKILSGNQNISCASCHHPMAGTSDGLSLPVGEGARGLGVTRDTGTGGDAVHERVPRNSPHVFNLGAKEFNIMFHDGRVEEDPGHPSGFMSPAGDQLPAGLDNVLAVQAMFPVTSGTEMAGQAGENTIADAAADGNLGNPGGVWEQLALRLRGIPEYVTMFVTAFDDIGSGADIEYFHAANAIAAFEAAAYRADNSPFDRYLRGDKKALSSSAQKGMKAFYGKAKCGECHSGPFQTNQEFAAVAMPQVGPGKGDNAPGYSDGHDDFGRERVTGDPEDRYRFRVPTLRNVAITGPWGHDGAYNTLESIVRHQLDPVAGLESFDPAQCRMPSRPDLDAVDFMVQGDAARRQYIADACELEPKNLSDKQVRQLIDFLHALTDPASLDMRWTLPTSVPSGLPLYE